jgi:hypothetical protein
MFQFIDSLLIFFTNLLIFLDGKVSRWGDQDLLQSKLLTALVKNNITSAIITLSISSFFVNLFVKKFNSRKHNQNAINKILEDTHLETFGVKPASDGNSRITYYKPTFIFGARPVFFSRQPFIKLQFGLGKYLVISTRTGCFQDSITKFKIHEDKQVSDNGIAGKAWYLRNEIIKEEKLPRPEGARASEYAKKSNINLNQFDNFNVKACSILGLAIQDVEGRREGVLVFDTKHSKFPDSIDRCISEVTKKLMYVV